MSEHTKPPLGADLTDALEALADLHAVQNGPPLCRDLTRWQAAMASTEEVLGRHGRLLREEGA